VPEVTVGGWKCHTRQNEELSTKDTSWFLAHTTTIYWQDRVKFLTVGGRLFRN
jgi:hypothetical protein